jgi:hypothetical protein
MATYADVEAETQLHQAVWAFHDALQRRDGVEARLRRGDIDLDLRDRHLRAAEAVTAARLNLYRALTGQGWTPPASVLRAIDVDEALLREPGA